MSSHVAAFIALHFPRAKRRGNQWRASCPVAGHGRGRGDRNPSLSIGEGDHGRVVMNCFAGCREDELLGALGVAKSDLYPQDQWSGACRDSDYRRLPQGSARRWARKHPPQPQPPPSRPPREEVEQVWRHSVSVTADAVVGGYLEGRGLNPSGIEWCGDLARALPEDVPMPPWAQCGGRSWSESDHRLIVPLYGPGGDMESLHARCIDSATQPKGVSPAGHQIGGLVMADGPGQSLLRERAWWSDNDPCRVLVVEGVPDYLVASVSVSEEGPCAPAIIGVLSGSWSQAIADRLPDHSVVTVATHDDRAGHRYADTIFQTLKHRCEVVRTLPQDLAEVVR